MARNPRDASQDSKLVQAAQAFAHIKRDLVRLLGILASDNPVVQDRVRECGGLPVVMNLCVIDDYNPCESHSKTLILLDSVLMDLRLSSYLDLREHAIFALRNLLHGNLESQAVVDRIRAIGK